MRSKLLFANARIQLRKPTRQRLCQTDAIVPKGRPKIAHRFIDGLQFQRGSSPVGTTEMAMFAGFQPSLWDWRETCDPLPTDKSVGYFHKIPTGFQAFDTASSARACYAQVLLIPRLRVGLFL